MAPALLVLGAALAVLGVGLVSVPASLVVAGVQLMGGAVGLAVVQERRSRAEGSNR